MNTKLTIWKLNKTHLYIWRPINLLINAPFYVSKFQIDLDLFMKTKIETLTNSYSRYNKFLTNHPNTLAKQFLVEKLFTD